jgi:hypothetical protein
MQFIRDEEIDLWMTLPPTSGCLFVQVADSVAVTAEIWFSASATQ